MDYTWEVINEINCDEQITEEDFWNGICVWIERPHLLNRRLLAAELLETFAVPETDVLDLLNKEIARVFLMRNLNIETLHGVLKDVSAELIKINSIKFIEKLINMNSNENSSNILLVRNLLSRNMKLYQDVAEISLFNKSECSVTFYPMKPLILMYPLSPTFPYKIKLTNKKIILEVFQNNSEEQLPGDSKSKQWLASEILPKVYKWCKNRPEGPIVPSLNLLSPRNYNANLHHLKEKYGKYYIKIWPEYNTTDPLKYVYEDISICAYLITLWEEEREKFNFNQKQTFVDLACGNGLLVDILTSEGYDGIGIDLRKRKIWDAFKCKSKLIEMVIEPCNGQLFPDYDWIIGNHPDELTPWIPFIAARSSYKMKVFLMPCCYYTFNGKYSRCGAGLTRYQSYLKFIQSLCEITGFNVQQDRLRIPSTKRTCFVCMSRSYDEKEEANMDLQRSKLISCELNIAPKEISSNNNEQSATFLSGFRKTAASKKWISDFKPREQKEPVRNCTDLDRKIIDDIVHAVFKILLSKAKTKCIGHDNTPWNIGGVSKLEDLIASISPNLLKCLKNQNGGFQTLLRNHRNIFEIKNGYVQIRIPEKCSCLDSSNSGPCSCQKINSSIYKTKKCFFHFYHPQGCPLLSSECTFSHDVHIK